MLFTKSKQLSDLSNKRSVACRSSHVKESSRIDRRKGGEEEMKEKLLEILKKERDMYPEYSYGVQAAWVGGFKEGIDRAIKIIKRKVKK